MKTWTSVRRLVALTAGIGIALGAAPGTASAAANPYTPTEACGSSYRTLDSLPVQTNSGATWGRVYLMYSNSTKRNCVATMKSSYVGTKTTTRAYLESESGDVSEDIGNFAYYAAAHLYAPGECVRYGGYIYSGPNSTGTYAYAHSGWGWCD
jgi:serine/threonine-protein kinase